MCTKIIARVFNAALAMLTFLLVVRHLRVLDSHRCTKGFSLNSLAPSSILNKYSAMWDNRTRSCTWSIIMKAKREQPLLKGKGLCVAGICSWGWVFSLLLSWHIPTREPIVLQCYTPPLYSAWATSGSSQPVSKNCPSKVSLSLSVCSRSRNTFHTAKPFFTNTKKP